MTAPDRESNELLFQEVNGRPGGIRLQMSAGHAIGDPGNANAISPAVHFKN